MPPIFHQPPPSPSPPPPLHRPPNRNHRAYNQHHRRSHHTLNDARPHLQRIPNLQPRHRAMLLRQEPALLVRPRARAPPPRRARGVPVRLRVQPGAGREVGGERGGGGGGRGVRGGAALAVAAVDEEEGEEEGGH